MYREPVDPSIKGVVDVLRLLWYLTLRHLVHGKVAGAGTGRNRSPSCPFQNIADVGVDSTRRPDGSSASSAPVGGTGACFPRNIAFWAAEALDCCRPETCPLVNKATLVLVVRLAALLLRPERPRSRASIRHPLLLRYCYPCSKYHGPQSLGGYDSRASSDAVLLVGLIESPQGKRR